jgi:hypothetical protein
MNMIELDEENVLIWPFQAESTKGKEVVIGEDRQLRMIRPKNLEIGQWKKNDRSKPRSHLKATFDILMAKYKEDRADIRGDENWTIQNTKSYSPVFLSHVSNSVAGISSGKRSQTPLR